MSKFIELTQISQERNYGTNKTEEVFVPVLVNADRIELILPNSLVVFGTHNISVKESPEQILKMIEEE